MQNTDHGGPLVRAAKEGKSGPVRRLLELRRVELDKVDEGARTPLSWAVEMGHVEVVRVLLGCGGVDPNVSDSKGQTPLLLAAKKGHIGVLQLLVERGDVNPNVLDIYNRTPLWWAAEKGAAVVRLLLGREDINPDTSSPGAETPLVKASSIGKVEVVELLLERDDVNPNRSGPWGRTPLHYAAMIRKGGARMAKCLLRRGDIRPDERDSAAQTPFMAAAEYGHTEVVEMLLGRGDVNWNACGLDNRTALSFAAERGQVAVVRQLAGQDIDPNLPDTKGQTPLIWAAMMEKNEAAGALLEWVNVDPNQADLCQLTPLHYAARRGNIALTDHLLKRDDIKPDCGQWRGPTPLLIAAETWNWGVAELLLKRGDVNPNIQGYQDRTPLSCAAQCGKVGIVQQLLGRPNINPNLPDSAGRTPLFWAAYNGHDEIVKLLSARDTGIPTHLLADSPPTICRLEITPYFAALTPKEKLYAHHISRASFLGTRVTLRQHSPEGEAIYDLILALYAACAGDWKKLASDGPASEQDVQYWLEYATLFLASLGNYKSSGDLKFVPRIPKVELRKLADYVGGEVKELFDGVEEIMYSVVPEERNLIGYIDAGHVSAYYPDSPSITKAEIEEVQAVTAANGILVENTRLKKVSDSEFHVLFASANMTVPKRWKTKFAFGESGKKKLKLVYGDCAELMGKISAECRAAAEHSANEIQRKMWEEYARSFDIGSIQAHKESQKYWVQDRGSRVEANIGFVETYRDPAGVRAEWEGFAGIVNEERMRTFGELVRRAEDFIARLPWGKDFEKNHFLKPDITSLEVLTFAGAGIPAGNNIPKYDDIRQEIGFKNVLFGNILSAQSSNERITFLKPEDVTLYSELQRPAFEVQVGIHGLLGHSTGKLLRETSPGEYNFDHANPPINPITNEPVETWYKPNETWGSMFGGLAASYEECRAELVAMYLGVESDLISIFDHASGQGKEDMMYIEYLQMARAGLLSVETWDPKSRKWGQAHSQARYFILQVFISAGDGFVTFSHSLPDMSDLTISIDRSKILTHGRKAVGEYLTKLHVYKSIADVRAGSELYNRMTEVTNQFEGYREVIMKLKQPRKVFVQANTVLSGEGGVELREYEDLVEGMVKSYAERGV